MMPTFPRLSLSFRTVGFLPVRLEGWLLKRCPSRIVSGFSLIPAYRLALRSLPRQGAPAESGQPDREML